MKFLQKAAATAIAATVLTVGATSVHSNSSAAAVIKAAESDAARASNALAKRKPEAAVGFAEQAVRLRPQDATYRALLGKAYLSAGRFFSAKQAFADALQLDPGLPGVALNLALASTATGDFAAAQAVLQANADTIAAADRGLAVALAGDPAAGIEILLPAARAPDADAKTRQNLALALALAGRWPEARQVAMADLSPADADARIVQWASFARPVAASDQVSALLGVTPVADAGFPVQLALVAAPVQVADVAPAEASPEPVAVAEAAPAQDVAAAETVQPDASSGPAQVVFAERREVVMKIPAPTSRLSAAAIGRAAPKPAGAAAPAATPAPLAKGSFHVQLGAYDSAAMAKWGWDRARARYAALSDKTPYTMPVGNGLVRVSVGGFARGDADRLCRSIRAQRGACFVRISATDKVASWVGGRSQMAARR